MQKQIAIYVLLQNKNETKTSEMKLKYINILS